jgi:glutamate racemase
MEKVKEQGDKIPLKAIILGCTHYPYVTEIIEEVLDELREKDRYAGLIGDSVYIIDPALNTARELYKHLYENNLLNSAGPGRLETSRFYISVPNKFESSVETETGGERFKYDYQYFTRDINELKDYIQVVPLSREVISDEQLGLIQQRLPLTYDILMQDGF